ncbi:hypothetical protein N0V84_001860 [Fusarium piperis]|uniref:non-specific serine/threonine protein kinase n=1 Tax=Fusarium piperis TaxID=1435070 RepID=A0A9W9BSP6_9HYPO|nr:hypothetical protein N0V84_001860 [Fusarium piperis]
MMEPPRSPSDINKIWNAFSGALEGLHHLHFGAIDAGDQTIHQDITPENLLVSKTTSSQPYDVHFVIIDFGYSHTKGLRNSQDRWGIDLHGGQIYGSPESSHHADYTLHGRNRITPKVDIWSLGCVMSEAAVWIKYGRQGLEDPVDPRVEDVVRQLGNNVKGRDHIFFVDVSQSMGQHFRDITEKFKILAYLAKQFDPDGVEVCFSSEVPVIHKENTTKLQRRFNKQKWDQLSFEDRIGTFIDRIAIPRLSSWHQKIGLTKPKSLTIFVLTDGRWGGGKEGAAGVENPIFRLINVILREELSRTQVAIQFLRFGDDADGKRYLTYLDHCGTQYKCDCVDTKPIDGNIFDMFIGPINADIDGVGEDVP